MATTIKPIYVNDVNYERLYPLVSLKPGAPRPYRTFPVIPPGWIGHVVVQITDLVLQDHWQKVAEYAELGGHIVGLGRWKPASGGRYGRFRVSNVTAR